MGEEDEYKPHEVQYRYKDLPSNHTRFDSLLAAGSQQERMITWWSYAVISMFVSAFVLLLLISIVIKPKVRKNPFNLFLIFLIIPDFVLALICGITCILNIRRHEFVSERWCYAQAFYCIWTVGSNAWLNAAIARHLHRMLVLSNRRERYFPPTTRQVVAECLGVYTWLLFVATWIFWPFLPMRVSMTSGVGCLPHEYDRPSAIFQWLVFIPCLALIPTGFACYVSFDVWYRKLLPPLGKRRELAVYFFRIVAIFLIMWVPSVLLMFLLGGYLPPWTASVGGSWSHFQGAVSGMASLMKRDIREAFLEFVTCGRITPQEDSSTPLPKASQDTNNTSEPASVMLEASLPKPRPKLDPPEEYDPAVIEDDSIWLNER